jgi:hypothetical protein
MAKTCNNHQSLRLIKVDGERPPATEWYECKCGQRLLVHIIATYPQDNDLKEARKEGIEVEKQYVAADKSAWGSIELARKRNRLLKEITTLEASYLYPRTEALDEGEGYIQHDQLQVDAIRQQLLSTLRRDYGARPEADLAEAVAQIKAEDPRSFRENPISHLMNRLLMIDGSGREWQTAAIAEDPKKAGGRMIELQPTKK